MNKITQNKIEIYTSVIILEKRMSVLIHSIGKVCEEIGTLICCCREFKLVQTQRVTWQYLSKLPMHTPFCPAIQFIGTYFSHSFTCTNLCMVKLISSVAILLTYIYITKMIIIEGLVK